MEFTCASLNFQSFERKNTIQAYHGASRDTWPVITINQTERVKPSMNNECGKLESFQPIEENNYSLFAGALEHDTLVFFHVTPKKNLCSILKDGFKSSFDLGTGQLASVSYAKKSSSCLAHLGRDIAQDFLVFAVRFETIEVPEIVENMSDIHVFGTNVQPSLIGYCEIPKGFKY